MYKWPTSSPNEMMLRTEINLVSELFSSQIKYILNQGKLLKQTLKYLL